MDHGAHDPLRRERGIEAARGNEEARRAIEEGGIVALLSQTQIQKTDITAAMLLRGGRPDPSRNLVVDFDGR
jgi:hypothetical protein